MYILALKVHESKGADQMNDHHHTDDIKCERCGDWVPVGTTFLLSNGEEWCTDCVLELEDTIEES